MGKKNTDEKTANNAENPEEKEEDTPIVKTLKEIDDRYCKLETEYDNEVDALRKKYEALQAPLLEERFKALADTSDGSANTTETGTPACPGFWVQAFQNSQLGPMVEEWDEPVLQYLKNIKTTDLGDNPRSGNKLEFLFAENPYFSNDTLWVEIHTDYDKDTFKPYNDVHCSEIKSSVIDWKAGKNVTVELTSKKVKGGGAKKAKQKAKAKEEPRDSFFRFVFRNLKKGDPLPADMKPEGVDEDDMDGDEMVDDVLEQVDQFSDMLKEVVIPYAIRLYTGEIEMDDDDDDDDEDEEEESGDEDDEDDDEVDSPRGKAKSKKKPVKDVGKMEEAGKKAEECKQQ